MRIVQVTPGSGDNFYCENCVRDNALVRTLHRAGHDVVAVPMYLPQRMDPNELIEGAPIFFGGVNAWLQQRFGLFRHTPRWVDRMFDARWLLRFAARRAGTVRARDLGEMTLSILEGSHGRQRKELARLLEWLGELPRPDIVHLSNPLLLGIGTAIKEHLGVPLVCSLQDEDDWIDAMTPSYAKRCWDEMARRAERVDAFIAVSDDFGARMRERLRIDAERMHTVYIGVDAGPELTTRHDGPPTIGYLARMAEGLGLGVLVDAFVALKARGTIPGLRLHVSGGSTGDDTAFLGAVRDKLAHAGVADDVRFFEAFDADARRRFLEALTVLSVPAPHGVAFGTYVLEALAAGVPVVEPRVGSYPELIDATAGGVLYEPNDAATLAETLERVLADPAGLDAMRTRGRVAVVDRFSPDRMVADTVAVYERVAALKPADAGDILPTR